VEKSWCITGQPVTSSPDTCETVLASMISFQEATSAGGSRSLTSSPSAPQIELTSDPES
jgi:hypothetical protein